MSGCQDAIKRRFNGGRRLGTAGMATRPLTIQAIELQLALSLTCYKPKSCMKASLLVLALPSNNETPSYKIKGGRGIELTQVGRVFLNYAKKILLQVDNLERELRSSLKRRHRHR